MAVLLYMEQHQTQDKQIRYTSSVTLTLTLADLEAVAAEGHRQAWWVL